jgi:hypothetical protein
MSESLRIIRNVVSNGTEDLEGFEKEMEKFSAECENDTHHCAEMPPEKNLVRQRHPEIDQNRWSPWMWRIGDKFPQDNAVFFCIYCMKNSSEF